MGHAGKGEAQAELTATRIQVDSTAAQRVMEHQIGFTRCG
jgi:hypothetical protein